jgi:hypothetical protein
MEASPKFDWTLIVLGLTQSHITIVTEKNLLQGRLGSAYLAAEKQLIEAQ